MKKLSKRVLSVMLAISLLGSMATTAFAHPAPTASDGEMECAVYYDMDVNENVIEYVSLQNINVVRTAHPNNTMTVETLSAEGSQVVTIPCNYVLFKELYNASCRPTPLNDDVTGSQFVHSYIGSPGSATYYSETLRTYRDASYFAAAVLSTISAPASAIAAIAGIAFARAYEDADFYKVVIASYTYEVLFAMDYSYFIHCYHQEASYYKKNASSAYLTERDYYQAIGG